MFKEANMALNALGAGQWWMLKNSSPLTMFRWLIDFSPLGPKLTLMSYVGRAPERLCKEEPVVMSQATVLGIANNWVVLKML